MGDLCVLEVLCYCLITLTVSVFVVFFLRGGGPNTLILDVIKPNMNYFQHLFVLYDDQHVCDGLCIVYVC